MSFEDETDALLADHQEEEERAVEVEEGTSRIRRLIREGAFRKDLPFNPDDPDIPHVQRQG